MANTININIKNCCCCGGGSGSTGGSEIVPIEGLPDPTGEEGPPEGYGEPSSITDRQCKVAVFLYEWVYWMLDALVNTTPGTWLVTFLNSAATGIIASTILTILSTIVGGALTSVATAGPDISDILWFPLGGAIAGITAAYILESFRTNNITLPLLEDALTKLPNAKDLIICKMAQGSDAVEVYAELEKVLAEPAFDLSFSQRKAIFALIPPQLVALLYWSADWWPSFETETLASITETCCGDLEDGVPLLPGTTTACDVANFIVDQLISLFNNTGVFINNYITYDIYNVILDLEGEIYDSAKTGLTVPTKIKDSAFNLDMYYRYLAKYMASRFFSWNPLDSIAYDTTFQDLAQYLIENDELFVCLLYNAGDPNAAHTALQDEIKTWLDANVSDTEQNGYLETAIQGIIHPQGEFLNLLFSQNTDLLGYTGVVDCSGFGGLNHTYIFNNTFNGWVNADCPDLSSYTRVDYTQETNGIKHTHVPLYSYAAIYRTSSDILTDTGWSELKANQIKVTVNFNESKSFGYRVLLTTASSGNVIKGTIPGGGSGNIEFDFSDAPDDDVTGMYIYSHEYYKKEIYTVIPYITIRYGDGGCGGA